MSYQWQQRKLLVKLGVIRTRYVQQRNFLIFIAFVVGLLSALAAVLLKLTVQFFEHQADRLNDRMHSNWLTAFFPLIGTGISLLLLVKVFRRKLQRGVTFIIEDIFTRAGRIHRRHILGQILTSAITVSTGGSVGLEAPIVAAGASLGSNTAYDMRLSSKDATLLLACGVASGIAAVFNSPFAGIIFTLEVLLLDFSIPFFIPLLISTATATVLSQLLYPDKFFFLNVTGWNIKAIPFYLLLGLGCGFTSVYVSWIVEKVEKFFHHKGLNWKSWLMGGLPLCGLMFLLPVLYGEGYRTITDLLQGHYQPLITHSFLQSVPPQIAIISMCILLILVKPLTATLTTGAGGNGGIFAPSMVIGGLTGFLFAYAVNLTGWFPLNTSNFIIAGMAGVLAGVMHAPLTAIFLLAEITGGYTLFVPLMIVVALSYFITRKYTKYSVYHKSLVEKHILQELPEDHF